MTSPPGGRSQGRLQIGVADAYLVQPTVDLLKLVIVKSLIAVSVIAG